MGQCGEISVHLGRGNGSDGKTRKGEFLIFQAVIFDSDSFPRLIVTPSSRRGCLLSSSFVSQSMYSLSRRFAYFLFPFSDRDNIHSLFLPSFQTLPDRNLFSQVSLGLFALHSHSPPIVHRNLKSPNICLTTPSILTEISEEEAASRPIAKIGSFWLSQMVFSELRVFTKNAVMGNVNPRWTSPEILRGLPYTEKSDIYALGLLLWELKYRRLAYEEEERHIPPRSRFHDLILSGQRPVIDPSDEYDRLCACCWMDNPSSRPAAHSVAQSLFDLVADASPLLAKSLTETMDVLQNTVSLPEPACAKSPYPSFRLSGPLQVDETRLTCSTLAGPILWVGGRNGKIGVYNIEEKAFLFADDGLVEMKALVQCICNMPTSSTVWSGSNSGEIIVWNSSPLNGKMAAEKVRWSGEVTKGFFRRSAVMTLTYGTISLDGSFITDSYSVRDLISAELTSSTSFLIKSKTDSQKYNCDDAANAVTHIQRCISYHGRKSVLFKRCSHRIADEGKQVIPVISLIEIDGKGWSLDGHLKVTEWSLEGSQEVWSLVPFRTVLDFSSVNAAVGSVPYPVGIWNVSDGEWLVGLGDHFVPFSRTSPLSNASHDYTIRGVMKNDWFDIPPDVRPKDKEILCVTIVEVFLNTKLEEEVWASTLMGSIFVWNMKTAKVRRRLVIDKIVSSMFTLNDEVWCGTTNGEILRMHIGTGMIIASEKCHSHVISGIQLYQSGGPKKSSSDEMAIYTASMDTTLQVRKSFACLSFKEQAEFFFAEVHSNQTNHQSFHVGCRQSQSLFFPKGFV
jgi:serine/threonine protein kinase